ncbi:MAG TPA: carboxypeptidase-like regulatory domain-containing protein [Pyrinomonadaceae bacterium]
MTRPQDGAARRRDDAHAGRRGRGPHATWPGRRRVRLAPALLAATCALFAPRGARAQEISAKGASGAGAVAGRVTRDEGKPAANVPVLLVVADYNAKPVARTTTDADGRYRIANVPVGRYRVRALAPAFASPEERAGGDVYLPGKTVNVGAGEAVEGVDLTLVRGGVITGRVTNAEGKPVVAERVHVTEGDQDARRRRSESVVPYNEFETDDRGVYRVFGLPAGRYVVSAGEDVDNNSVRVGGGPQLYARTFHPNATDPAQARAVDVSPGAEARDVDITLADAPKTYAARGRIVDEAGRPVAGVTYWWGPLVGDAKTLGGTGSEGVPTNADGEFVVPGLLPGRYAVYAADAGGANTVPLGNNYSDAATFEVADADVSGLVVKIHPGASVSGSVTLEGTTDRATLAKLTRLLVSVEVRPSAGDASAAPLYEQGNISADGKFRVEGLRPGRVRLNIWNRTLRSPFTLLGVQRGGADASAGFDLSPGEQVADVRLRVGYGTGIVRGRIELRDGAQAVAPPAGASLYAYARRLGGVGTIGETPVEVDANGGFLIEGLMGGEYDIGVGGSFPPSPANPNGRRLPALKQKLNVSDAGETPVTIVYDLSKPPEGNP